MSVAVAAIAVGALIASPVQASEGAAVAAAAPCPPGRPGIAVQVGWRVQDVNWLVMVPHVQVANCRSRVHYVRIRLESFNNGFPVQWKTSAFGTYPKKYGNANMTVHWPNYLPVLYEAGQSGRYTGIGFADVYPDSDPGNAAANQRPYELATCTRRVDGLDIDTSAVTFTVSVWPLDKRHRPLPDVGGAVLGPFTCGQANVGTT